MALAEFIHMPTHVRVRRCHLCSKYLSVPPIIAFNTESSAESQYVCGRCEIPRGQSIIRDTLYEELASHVLFPCSNSDCPDTLQWGSVSEHEQYCLHRVIQCCICKEPHKAIDLVKHFEQRHANHLFSKENLVITKTATSGPDSSAAFLVVTRETKTPFIVYVELKRSANTLLIKIVPQNKVSDPYVFDVTFSSEISSVEFAKQEITKCLLGDDWLEQTYDISLIEKMLKSDKSLTIHLSIYDINTRRKPFKKSVVSLQETFKKAVECPVCLKIMRGSIQVCREGHSVCGSCKAQLTSCPLCRGEFLGIRNRGLEEMATNFQTLFTPKS